MLKTDKQIHIIKAAILALAMAALPLAAHAAGLGKISVFSALGQPLKAELEVFATSEEAQSLQAKLASADAFRQADIEYVPVLVTLKFSREVKERDGHRYIQVTTDRPVNEPFIDMLVEMNWASGRLVREYTFLLDPPDLVPATSPAPVAVPAVKFEAAAVQPAEKPPVAPVAESPPVGDARPAMPKPAAGVPQKPADTSVAPVAKMTGSTEQRNRKVAAGDTLGKIAAQTRPAGVSLDQMLVALFRNNQTAFDGGNMNRLRAGKILAIPDDEAVGKIAADEARKEVVAQAADFNAYRKKLATIAATEAAGQESVQQAASGKIAPRVEEPLPAGGGKDKLEVSRTEAAKGGQGKLQERISTLEEDLLARDRALKEANSRAADLEKSLNSMKKLAELKSRTGTDLQQQTQTSKLATPPSIPSVPAASKPEVSPAPVVKADIPADAVKPAEPASPPAAKPRVEKKKIAPPPPPEPEPGFMEENGPLVFGGGGVLALLLGWFGFSAWRKKRKAIAGAGEATAGSDFSVRSTSGTRFGATSVAPPSSEQQPSRFSVSPAELVVDALTEADTFLAFGRDAQAEEVLLAGLEKEPERHALYLKLLEIYAGRKNLASFEAMAKRLRVQTGGNGADWEKAVAMGASLDSGNVLYQSASPVIEQPPAKAEAEAPDFGATLVLPASPLAAESSAPSVDLAPAATQEDVDTATLDFDLDLDLGAKTGGVADASPETAAPAAMPDMAALDFDLDLGSPDASITTASVVPVVADSAAAPLDLPLGDETAIALPGVSAGAGGADANSIDFDFDLVLDKEVPASVPAAALDLDLDSISLDLNAVSSKDGFKSGPTFDVSAGKDVADNPEVATKLELAAAYEEMGDREGARELYQEALAEGSAAQQEVARTKLASLG